MVVFVVVLQFIGVFLVFLIFPLYLIPFLEERFEVRLPKEVPPLDGHVVIYGYGAAVETLLSELARAGLETVVVEAEGQSWLVDPSLMLRRPVALTTDPADVDQHPAEAHRIEASAEDAWLVHWSPMHFNHPIPCLIYGAETTPEQAARRAADALE